MTTPDPAALISFVLSQVISRTRSGKVGQFAVWPRWAIDALSDLAYHRDGQWPGSVKMLDALAAAAKREGLT